MFMVFDDLALELGDNPIIIPIPPHVLEGGDTDKKMRAFTTFALKHLMRLPFFTWTHHIKDVIIDGFMVRQNKIYPEFST
jgi:hypothetical protein